jgi:hypothetical protein
MKGSVCPGPEELASYADGSGSIEVRTHVESCRRCATRLRFLAAPDGERGLVEEAAREAEASVRRLLSEPPHRWPLLAGADEFRSVAVAHRLLRVAIETREAGDLRTAVAAADAVTVIADAETVDHFDAAELRFDAWKYRSAFLRELGDYEAAKAAFAHADDASAFVADPVLARASIALARAMLCAEPDVWQPEEAAALLDGAERVFAARRDERLRAARTVRAMLLLRSGDAAFARAIFENVLAAVPSVDEPARADALANVLAAAVEMADWDLAERIQPQVAAINRRLGRTIHSARDRWEEARIARGRNDHAGAVHAASQASREFEALGMVDDAIRAGLIAVYSLAVEGELDAALELNRSLVEKAIALDRKQPSRRHALTAEALTYLRELAQRRMLTGDAISEIESYLDRIFTRPPVNFRPSVRLISH